MNAGDQIAAGFADVPSMGVQTGVFVGMNGALARVRVSEADIDLPMVGATVLRPGEPVQVLWANGSGIVLGPAVARSATGSITAVVPPRATVVVDGQSYSMPYRTGAAPVVGDIVEVNWSSGVIAGAISAKPEEKPVPDLPPQQPEVVEYVIRATSSYRYGTEWTEGPLWASAEFTSVWTYGQAFAEVLTDVTLLSLEVFMPLTTGGEGVSVGTHGYVSTPTGVPALENLTSVTVASGWVAVPLEFAPALTSGGIGVTGGTETQWVGVNTDPASGAIRVRGTIQGGS